MTMKAVVVALMCVGLAVAVEGEFGIRQIFSKHGSGVTAGSHYDE